MAVVLACLILKNNWVGQGEHISRPLLACRPHMDKLCVHPGGEVRVTRWLVITPDVAGAGSALLPAQSGTVADVKLGRSFHDTVCFLSLPPELLPGACSLPAFPLFPLTCLLRPRPWTCPTCLGFLVLLYLNADPSFLRTRNYFYRCRRATAVDTVTIKPIICHFLKIPLVLISFNVK